MTKILLVSSTSIDTFYQYLQLYINLICIITPNKLYSSSFIPLFPLVKCDSQRNETPWCCRKCQREPQFHATGVCIYYNTSFLCTLPLLEDKNSVLSIYRQVYHFIAIYVRLLVLHGTESQVRYFFWLYRFLSE
jgi:hypothetical protein